MDLSELDYDLPESLIAQEPLPERDASRLLVVSRDGSRLEHRQFRDLPLFLKAGDLLLVNDAKVLPARVRGKRVATGGNVELLYLGRTSDGFCEAMLRTRGKLSAGERLEFCEGRLVFRLVGGEGRLRKLESLGQENVEAVLAEAGEVPLPPYIQRAPDQGRSPLDQQRYQTIFAERAIAAAAPTAGLHFSQSLIDQLVSQGIEIARVTLQVGAGTFLPIETLRVEDHPIHEERYWVPQAALEAVKAARARGSRVVAVGTTSLRAIESAFAAYDRGAADEAIEGATRLFIMPGYSFKAATSLITNFHVPRSSLLALVMAWLGKDLLLRAYREAVERRYRFFSYGDAMLIL